MNHPETAATYNNLGNAYQDAGDDGTAEWYYTQCLEIQKKVYGNVNPDIAASYNNIATVWVRQGRLKDAENLADIREQINSRDSKSAEATKSAEAVTLSDP